MDAFATVFSSHEPFEIDRVLESLESEGIVARTDGDRHATRLGASSILCEIRVIVNAQDAERAREIIEAFLEARAVTVVEPPPAPGTAALPQAETGAGEQGPLAGSQPDEPATEAPVGEFSRDPVWRWIIALGLLQLVLWAVTDGRPDAMRDAGAVTGWPGWRDGYRLFLAGFLHFDPVHLALNLFSLSLFGWAAVRLFGLPRAALAYLAAGLASGAASAAWFDASEVAAGSSGSVYALVAMVLAGKARLARRATVARGRAMVRVAGWAVFSLPGLLQLNLVAHVSGAAIGLAAGLLARFAEREADPARVRRSRTLARAAAALLVLPFAWRLAAPLYAPCLTGSEERCRARCAGGEAVACWEWAQRLLDLRARTEGEPALAASLERACEGGLAQACHAQAQQLLSDSATAEDAERARELERRACEGRVAAACTAAGAMIPEGPENDAAANRWFTLACEDGDGVGCYQLGWAHEHGNGVEVSLPRAAQLFELACAGDVAEGCTRLADLLGGKRGLEADADRARSLLERACELGDRVACSKTGGDPPGFPRRPLRDRPRPDGYQRRLHDALRVLVPGGG